MGFRTSISTALKSWTITYIDGITSGQEGRTVPSAMMTMKLGGNYALRQQKIHLSFETKSKRHPKCKLGTSVVFFLFCIGFV